MTLKLIPLGAVVSLSLAAAGAQQPLPDGPGKQTVARVCSACHDLDTATGARHTRAEWRAIVDAMVIQGARATDEEIAAIIEYLATNIALVNVNKAAPAEIEVVLAIASSQAAEIVRYRTENGAFKDLDSLKKVPGIDAGVLEDRKDRIAFK